MMLSVETTNELRMMNIASIDIGSHTARLLVSQKIGDSGHFRPILRKREYVRLAKDFEDHGKEILKPEAIDRTLKVLQDFASIINKNNVDIIHAVSTGVTRRAVNRGDFLDLIYRHTGIRVNVISGEKEARLTQKGVLHSLDIHGQPFIIFDLGGGSTEFIFGDMQHTDVRSIPLGVMILTQRYMTSDPPEKKAIETLIRDVDGFLKEAFFENAYPENDSVLVGTGGTVTTLAAMIYGIGIKGISPDKMNGLILKREPLEELFGRLKTLTIDQRLKLPGLDRGRADVIFAGSIAAIRIMHFFKSHQIVVSLSDILEGIVIETVSA